MYRARKKVCPRFRERRRAGSRNQGKPLWTLCMMRHRPPHTVGHPTFMACFARLCSFLLLCSAETILIPKESWFWFLAHFWPMNREKELILPHREFINKSKNCDSRFLLLRNCISTTPLLSFLRRHLDDVPHIFPFSFGRPQHNTADRPTPYVGENDALSSQEGSGRRRANVRHRVQEERVSLKQWE